MKKLLFIFFTLPLFIQAQSIITGDSLSAGVIYKNIKDSNVVAQFSGVNLANFDIDGDLTKDIRVYITWWSSAGWNTLNKSIQSLNNVDFAAVPASTSFADTMAIGNLINQSLTWNASGGLTLFNYSSTGSTVTTSGLFLSINKYLAFRIKKPTDTIYGWFLMDFPNLGTVKVRSWAYKSKILGVKNLSRTPETLSAFPNPAFNELNLICKGHLIKEVTLFNCRGEEILKQKPEIMSENSILNISELEEGVFFIQLSTEDSIFTKKFIKE